MTYDQRARTPPWLRDLRPDSAGRVFDRNGWQLWPEVPGCTCRAVAAEFDPLSHWLYVTHERRGCLLHQVPS
jgi:hypothetical protein